MNGEAKGMDSTYTTLKLTTPLLADGQQGSSYHQLTVITKKEHGLFVYVIGEEKSERMV